MISWSYLSRLLVLAVAVLALTGCGSGNNRVQGEVRYNGELVDQGGIAFIPEGEGKDATQHATTAVIQQGRYDSGTSGTGPAPGTYRVKIYWQKKTGKKTEIEVDRSGTKVVTFQRKQAIPPKYNEKTELTVEIKPGNNTLNFDLSP